MMNKKSIAIAVLVLVSVSTNLSANLITDGDFGDGASLTGIEKNWDINVQKLNQWYTWEDSKGTDFYSITDGYVSPATASQDSRLLLQVIKAPDAGDYKFNFDYKLSDDSDMYSIVRVFGLSGAEDLTVDMTKYYGKFTNYSGADYLYDQGGRDSSLAATKSWESVSADISVKAEYDYLVVYSVFSFDGKNGPGSSDFAGVDNFSIVSSAGVPEPSSIVLFGFSYWFLARRRK